MSTPTLTPDPQHSTDYVTAWKIASRRHPHITYVVTYDRLGNDFHCQCAGFFYRGTCTHVDAAIKALVADWRTPKAKAGAA
jgi:hypothetical protein